MCGLFGIVNYRRTKTDLVSKLVKALAKESTDRGTDAGGLAYYGDKGALTVIKNHQAIDKNGVLDFSDMYTSSIIMGHTRATTQGLATKNQNNHPFMSSEGNYALAHNGVLSNDEDVMTMLKLKEDDVETDSYVLVRMLDQLHGGVVNFNTLRACGEQLGGTYNFTILDGEGALWILRHNNPLTIVDFKELGLIAYASTGDILISALRTFYDGALTRYLFERTNKVPFGKFIETDSGDILRIDQSGMIMKERFEPSSKVISDPNKWKAFNFYTNQKGQKIWYPTGTSKSYADEYADETLEYYRHYYGGKESFNPTKAELKVESTYAKMFDVEDSMILSQLIIDNGRELENVGLDSGRYAQEVFSAFLGEYIVLPDEFCVVPSEKIKQGLTLSDLMETKGNYVLDGKHFGDFVDTLKTIPKVVEYTEYLKKNSNKDTGKNLIRHVYLYLYLRTMCGDEILVSEQLSELLYSMWTFPTFMELYEHLVSFIYYEYYYSGADLFWSERLVS